MSDTEPTVPTASASTPSKKEEFSRGTNSNFNSAKGKSRKERNLEARMAQRVGKHTPSGIVKTPQGQQASAAAKQRKFASVSDASEKPKANLCVYIVAVIAVLLYLFFTIFSQMGVSRVEAPRRA